MATVPDTLVERLPTHLDLPETDGLPVENTYQPEQSRILIQSIRPWLIERIHPDGQFLVAGDHGIYFRYTNPPLDGCRAPDWFYVPNVPSSPPDHWYRRSYVLWQERVPPYLVIEYVSGNGTEERDRTPNTGKFWIYEQAIRTEYYVIYFPETAEIEAYQLVEGRYQPLAPNQRGHYPIPYMQVEIGIQSGTVGPITTDWLRFYDPVGNLLLHDGERAEQERQRAEQEWQRAEQERQRAEQERQRAEQERRQAEQERQRAEQERQRAEVMQQQNEALKAKLRALGIDPDQMESPTS